MEPVFCGSVLSDCAALRLRSESGPHPGYWWPVGKPWAVVVSAGKKHPFAPRGFSAMVSTHGVVVYSRPPEFQAGVVQAGFGRVAPFGLCSGFRLGRPLSFLARLEGRLCRLPRQPNPALKGTRGYALACFPLVPPARAP